MEHSNGSATVTKTSSNKASTSASAPSNQGNANPKHDFFWTYTEEPHRTRRLAIIKAHPEVCVYPYILPTLIGRLWIKGLFSNC